MAKSPIRIKKIKEEAEIYYYSVFTSRNGVYSFFIGIDPQKNRVLFFNTPHFSTPINIIDFGKQDDLIEITGIDREVSNLVAMQGYKAILKNEFPEGLSIN